jgi:hypothetical protein
MKNTILFVMIAAFFAACNSQPQTLQATNTPTVNTADTAGLHEYQMYKQQKELSQIIETEGINDGMNSFASNTPAPVYASAPRERIVYVNNPAPARRTAARSTTRRSSGGGYSRQGTVARSSQSIPARRKGWSKAAKGTAIGGASGAVLGAIVSKKKVKGAIIGGVVGAAGGYILGRSMDKRDGRY